jgi:hypothetical protein
MLISVKSKTVSVVYTLCNQASVLEGNIPKSKHCGFDIVFVKKVDVVAKPVNHIIVCNKTGIRNALGVGKAFYVYRKKCVLIFHLLQT